MKNITFLLNKKFMIVLFLLAAVFSFGPLQAAPAEKVPKMITLDSLKDKYGAVHFNHSEHVSLAGDCGKCHHQHGSNSSLPCKECHSLSPEQFRKSVINTFIACRNCHDAPDRSNPGMPGLKAAYHEKCFQCHRGMAGIGDDPKACAEMCHAKREQPISKRAGN